MPDYSKSGIRREDPLTSGDPRVSLRQKLRSKGVALSAEKQPLSDSLTSISSGGITANQMLYGTADSVFSKTTVSDFAIGLLADSSGIDVRNTIGARVSSSVLTGTNASASATLIELQTGGGIVLEPGNIGIPVAASMRATSVAVSWLASAPSSGWTLTLHKRTGGGTLNEVATFTINT